MTEIGLTVAISLAALTFAALLARRTVSFDTTSPELRRLNGAVRRAAEAVLWGAYRSVMVTVAGAAVLLFTAHAYLATVGGQSVGLQVAFHTGLFLLAGTAGACITAHSATHVARLGSFGAIAGARVNLDTATVAATRAAAAAAFVAVSTSLLSAALVGVLVFALLGGFSGDPTKTAQATTGVAMLLPAHALGSGLAALVLQRAGAVYGASSRVGAALIGESQGGLRRDDSRNPATVAKLVGTCVGSAATCAVDFNVAVSTATVVGALLGSTAYANSDSMALALFPLVVLAFGILASAFGVMVVRHADHEPSTYALWRGQAATTIVTLGGLAGASIWLLEDHWKQFFAAGSISLAALAVVVHLGRLRLSRRLGLLRELQDAARLGAAPTISAGIGIGLQTALAPIAVIGLVLACSWQLGDSSGIPLGGLAGMWTAVVTLLAAGPYLLAASTFDAIASGCLVVLAMSPPATATQASPHAHRLDEAGFETSLVTQPYLIVTGGLVALSAALVIPAASGATEAAVGSLSVDLANPLVLWAGFIGAGAVLGYSGQVLRLVTTAVRDVAKEIERQLRRFPRERGIPAIPEDFAPSYRTCIDLATRRALSKWLVPVAMVASVPAGVAFAATVVGGTNPSIGTEALASFLTVAAATGLGAALIVDSAGTLLVAGRRIARQRGTENDTEGTDPTSTGDAIANMLRSGAGAPALLTMKVIAIVTLVIMPFVN